MKKGKAGNRLAMRAKRSQGGFTMIEMMAVLIIIAVLIAGGIKFYTGYVENARVTKAKSQIGVMQGAMDSWFSENGAYPGTDELKKAGIDTGAKDPWGLAYQVKVSDEANKTSYQICSGQHKVQGEDGQYVIGTGKEGESEAPTIGKVPNP